MRRIFTTMVAIAMLGGCGGGATSGADATKPDATSTADTGATDATSGANNTVTSATTAMTGTAAATTATGAEEGDEGDLRERFKQYDDAFATGDSSIIYEMHSTRCQEKYSRGQYSTVLEVAHVVIEEFYDLDLAEVHNSDPEIDFKGSSADLTYELIGPDDKPLGAGRNTSTWIFEDGEWVRDTCDFDEALGIVSPDATVETTDASAEAKDAGSGTDAIGTRDNPIPLGQAADVGDGWSLKVNSVVLDAADQVAAANPFNEPAPDGKQYVLVEVTVAYNGDEQSSSQGVSIKALGEGTNKPVATYDASVVPPEPQYSGGELFQGGEETGYEVLLIDNSDADTLLILGEALFSFNDNDRKFFATN